MRYPENITILKCLDHILRLPSFFLEHPNVFLTSLPAPRGHGDNQRCAGSEKSTRDGATIRLSFRINKIIRNTEAGKHWLKEEEEGSYSSDDEEPEGSEAGQEPAREEGEISNPSEDSDEPGSNGEAEQYTSEVEVCSAEYSSS